MSASPEPPAGTISASHVEAWLIGRIRFYDQVDPESVVPGAVLSELGLDSIYVLTLCGDIEDAYGVEMDPTFLAEYTTISELADGLADYIPRR